MANTAYFDDFGRCIPNGLQAEHHLETRRYFLLDQPKVDYKTSYERLVKHLKIESAISLQDFTLRAENILDTLRADDQCKNILNGVHVPFMLRKKPIIEMGLEVEQHYIYAVKNAFEEAYPTKTFTNHHKDGLEGKLKVATGSRHQRLVDAMQKEIVVGYYFPCLMEYSVPATLEQVAKLPEQFLLAGGCDTAAALVGSPDLLLRKEGYPPVIWFAGLDAEKQGVGYHFEAYGYNLTFNRKPHFDKVAESWTSGVVVLGQAIKH